MRSKRQLIKMMEFHGYYYDEIDSHDTWLVFNHELGHISFNSWADVDKWLDGIVWEELAE